MDTIILSYNIARLLDDYHQGSRQWLYDRVNTWLCDCINQAAHNGHGGSERMTRVEAVPDGQSSRFFLMLADAGMGKSVFSAVMHTKLTMHANKEEGMLLVGGSNAFWGQDWSMLFGGAV